MYPTISIGSLVFPASGIVYIIGVWFMLSAAERAAKALRVNADIVYGIAVTGLTAGFLGARLMFVILHWPAYRQNLVGIVWPLTSGYELWAGIITGVMAAFFYGRSKMAPPLASLDALAPGLVIGFMIISLADFLGGPGYGVESQLPWAIDVFGVRRHPVQLYELFLGLGALLASWALFRRGSKRGQIFLTVVAIYSGGRLFIDAFRANAPLTVSGFHIVQIVSLALLLAAFILLGRLLTDGRKGEAGTN